MSDVILDDYRAFFRTHELNGTPARLPSYPYTLRVPVNCIIVYADAVKNLGPLNGRQLDYLHGIIETAQHLLRKLPKH